MANNAAVRAILISIQLAAAFAPVQTALARAADPGVRREAFDNTTPAPIAGLGTDELAFFEDGLIRFGAVEVVSGASNTALSTGNGLGPRFNSNSCQSCHFQPNVGGSSPARNPLFSIAVADGASNSVPWFLAPNGPIREARFVQSNGVADGGVHNLFVVTGRADAGSCAITQPSFTPAGDPISGQGGNDNVVFRIPTPIFGAGLIEAIPDSVIIANAATNAAKAQAGVQGHPNAIQGGTVNLSANDGTITRFGWKAQNKSLLMFAGEAYNVEMGVSNQLFPQERDETPSCHTYPSTPEDTNNFPLTASGPAVVVLSDIEAFANFMRMLAPPTPAPDTASTIEGRAQFIATGCALCHTPSLMTGKAIATGSSVNPSSAMSHQRAKLFSDLLVHHMGQGLADGITQGAAGPDDFRTAPLWGLGQRIFFLHDGRTSDLMAAIEAHQSQNSEANTVIQRFNNLPQTQQQDILNFLRAL